MFDKSYVIQGKHATMLKTLSRQKSKNEDGLTDNNAGIFERYIDVYMNALLFGVLNGTKATKDNTSNDTATIFADAFVNEREKCMTLFRMAMMLDDVDIPIEERINRAFKYEMMEGKEVEFLECVEIFNEYVLGGIEVMFKSFTEQCTSKNDYINRIHDIIKEFKEDNSNINYEAEIAKLMKK